LLPSFPDFRFADARLHRLIARASKSPRLESAETEIQSVLTEIMSSTHIVAGTKRLLTYAHDPIIQAMRPANGTVAREAMLTHIEDTFSWVTMMISV
jgi:DNA-binding FadR family transcriptional regulator